MKDERDVLLLSIKDLLTPKMLKYSVLPIVISLFVMYVSFFSIAGVGLEHLGSLDVQSAQTSVVDGVPHTESFSAQLEGSSIIQFLMNYTITSWIASFLVYAIGGFFMLYVSIFIALIVIGFLTPLILKEVQARHYMSVEIIGHSNIVAAILLAIKWAFTMLMLFFLLIPLYFIPLVNIIAFNLPLYYFFHKMLNYDISSTICTQEESKQIQYFSKNKLRLKTLALYLISLIPFTVFLGSIFFVIYLGHTYFIEVQKLRLSSQK